MVLYFVHFHFIVRFVLCRRKMPPWRSRLKDVLWNLGERIIVRV